ncbi:zinc-dependent metalloprotease family protein [Flavobacterium sp.]|uniref:zinc-dependent metalloprotease family protein n=1 Tax=Flavobacterium sp. TaxID=239 RepID=UPI00262E1150|nr:zinc-dependent metalloprotease family protein [Flavobacterium sp.]
MRYLLFILFFTTIACNKTTVTKETVVGIIPYRNIDDSKVALVSKAITDYYGIKVKVLPHSEFPSSAFVNIKSPRYRADSLIAIQERNMQPDVDYILGLTDKDISVTKRDENGNIKPPEWKYNDFGVMGLAYRPGNSCIVSDFRLKHKNKEVQFGRFKKVAIHELGHNFGLPHCPDKSCVMTDAVERISTIDNAKPELCIACKKKLNISR